MKIVKSKLVQEQEDDEKRLTELRRLYYIEKSFKDIMELLGTKDENDYIIHKCKKIYMHEFKSILKVNIFK